MTWQRSDAQILTSGDAGYRFIERRSDGSVIIGHSITEYQLATINGLVAIGKTRPIVHVLSADGVLSPGVDLSVGIAGRVEAGSVRLIAGDATEPFVVSFADLNDPAVEVYARILSPAGAASGPPVRLNGATVGSQTDPAGARLSNGDYVFAWTDSSKNPAGNDQSGTAIRVRRFDPSLTPLGPDLQANTDVLGDQTDASVVALAGGGFAVVWIDWTGPRFAGAYTVRAQMFDETGARDGKQITVFANLTEDLFTIDVAPAAPKTFLIPGGFQVALTTGSIVKTAAFDGAGRRQTATDTLRAPASDTVTVDFPDGRHAEISGVGLDLINDPFVVRIFGADGAPSGAPITIAASAFGALTGPEPGIGTLPPFVRFSRAVANGDDQLVLFVTSPDEPDPDGQLNIANPPPFRKLVTMTIDLTRYAGDASAESVAGGGSADHLSGAGGADTLNGFAGSDTLEGGSGADRLDGGAGVDTASYAGSGKGVRVTLAGAVGEGEDAAGDILAGIENLVGSRFADILVGQQDANDLRGGAGADTLVGDGPLSLTAEAQSVRRLYIATLDRGPDEAGWLEWTTRLQAGQTFDSIVSGFIESPEFQARFGGRDDTGFVTLLYRNVLDREPDAPGLSAWLGALASGKFSRAKVVAEFSESAEFRISTSPETHAGQIFRLFGATLARQPDVGGFEFWTDAMGSGRSLVEVAGGFVGSPEFQARFGGRDDVGFVTLLYQNVLQRAPDKAGLADWVGLLGRGLSRTEAVIGFSESQEFVDSTRVANDAFMRKRMTIWSDTLAGGEGNDDLTGGRGADRFVFAKADLGDDTIHGFDRFDTVELQGLGFKTQADVLAALIQKGGNVVLPFSRGSITFEATELGTLQNLPAEGWVLG